MIRTSKSWLVVILAAVAAAVAAQAIPPHQIKSAYLIRFFDYITWENEGDIRTFRIGVVGDDDAIFGELGNAARTVKVKGRPITVGRAGALADMPDFEMLFVARNAPFPVRDIAAATRRTNTLIVTDGSNAKRDFMINLVERADKTIGFEVNRSNIVFERLKIDIGILVLGGTELDVAELVKETEGEMAQAKEQLTAREQELQRLQKEVAAQTQKLGEQASLIEQQTAGIRAREAELAGLQERLEKAGADLAANESKLGESQKLLDDRLATLSGKESEIARLSKSIDENTALLEQQRRELESKESTLSEQSRSLQRQDVTIAVQRTGLVLAALALLVFVILTGIILHISNDRRKVNTRLSEAKEIAERASAIANTTLQNMGQGILMVDGAGHILVFNDLLIQYLGVDRERAAACRTVRELAELSRNRIGDAATQRSLELAGKGGNASYELAMPDRIIDVRQNPLVDGGFVRTYTDISARKHAEESLKQSEQRLALAMQAGRFTPWEADLKSGKTLTLSFYEQILGYAPGEMQDTLASWKSVVHPDDLAPFEAEFRKFIEGRSSTFRFQYRAFDRQKNERWVEAVGTIVERDETGRPMRIIGTQQDVTERRAMELLAQARMRELEEFNRVAVGRELRMIELKKEINGLLAGLGRDRQYEIVE